MHVDYLFIVSTIREIPFINIQQNSSKCTTVEDTVMI